MKKSMIQLAILAQYGSQRKFSEKAGLSELQVSQVVTGRRKLGDAQKARWARLLSTPKRLLFGDQEKEVA